MARNKTPLRYPGGKQKLAPFILEVMDENELLGGEYAEPYAGGAGVAIELLLTNKVSRIHLNDSCSVVFAFWHAILNDTDEFCRRVKETPLTVSEWQRQKKILSSPDGVSKIDLGFAMFYLNRCNRSGILTAGVIGGIKQDGDWKMDARFDRESLVKRIEAIALKRASIRIRNWDAERFITQYIPKLPDKTLVYCDPPYYQKADRLYLNHYLPADHARIAKVIQSHLHHHWVVSYDSAPEVMEYYEQRECFLYSLQYNAGKAYKGTEVIIFSDDLKIPDQSTLPFINDALVQRI